MIALLFWICWKVFGLILSRCLQNIDPWRSSIDIIFKIIMVQRTLYCCIWNKSTVGEIIADPEWGIRHISCYCTQLGHIHFVPIIRINLFYLVNHIVSAPFVIRNLFEDIAFDDLEVDQMDMNRVGKSHWVDDIPILHCADFWILARSHCKHVMSIEDEIEVRPRNCHRPISLHLGANIWQICIVNWKVVMWLQWDTFWIHWIVY